ncbi:MAG TPA: hypothetical protein VE439_05950, partial [Anaerolineae bacterium]|nr:hypothetical protein [Anaerolineae bacterium]
MRGKANLSEPLLPENVRAKVQDKELCQGRINSINPEYISYYMEQLIYFDVICWNPASSWVYRLLEVVEMSQVTFR